MYFNGGNKKNSLKKIVCNQDRDDVDINVKLFREVHYMYTLPFSFRCQQNFLFVCVLEMRWIKNDYEPLAVKG